MANVHKPIMVREYDVGAEREDAKWPMFWASKEGCCPFIQPPPQRETKPVITRALRENTQTVNKKVVEQPASMASGIINSSNAFSAIRSTTTCGSKSMTSIPPTQIMKGSTSRQIRDLKTRQIPASSMEKCPMHPPPAKRRRVEPLRLPTPKKKVKREGYCENCKERYDDYEEVRIT
jgi:hypothetical protein